MAKVERVNEKTPNGGDYSEIHYLDADMNPVEPEEAFQMIVWECKKDGTIIRTTRALCEPKGQNGRKG